MSARPASPPAAPTLAQQRADAARAHPFWPFGERTPAQVRAFERQQAAYRAGLLLRWPAARL